MAEAKKSKFDQAVADLVKKMRKEKGLSQNQIASYIGVHRSFVAHIELHESDAKYNINHINQIAYFVGCSPRDLMPDEPIPEEIKKPPSKYPVAKKTRKKKKG